MSLNLSSLVVASLMFVSSSACADDLRVRDIPIPDDAQDVTVMKRRGDIRFTVEKDFHAAADFYAQKLSEQGWTKAARENIQRNFLVRTYTKGNATLEVRADQRGGSSEVRLTPQGMKWDEDDQPTPKDLPIPQNARLLEYDDFFESIEFTSPDDVKTVVAYLTKELEQRKWKKTSTDFDLDTFVRMSFQFDKSTLTIDVREEDEGSEVEIDTEGMQWDGMKEEIARAEAKAEAEREAEQESVAKQKEMEAANRVATLPERKERPKQGIEQLEKLPSVGVVVMDDKEFKLEHVIAYEVFEYERWQTKIVATQKPVKQATLIDRLKKTGTDWDDDENPMSWPEPFLEIVLDEDDEPQTLSLRAAGVPGVATSDELSGTALVEDGRVRGTVKLTEPGSFFDNVYSAEISFDVSLITRESEPAKRLADAEKLANAGTLTIGGKTYKLGQVVAYPMMFFDEPMTTIVLSEKSLDLKKLKASLGKEAANDYFEFTPQVRLMVDEDDNLQSISIWADNISLSGNQSVDSDIAIEDGRVRGQARMTEPGEFFEKEYTFEVSFDVDLLGEPTSRPQPNTSGLVADAYDGLPIPEGHEGIASEGSPFMKMATTTVTAELKQVVDFYRAEFASGNWGEWKEDTAAAAIDGETARLVFNGDARRLVVDASKAGENVELSLKIRDAEAAKQAGLLPKEGKGRLLIANASERDETIVINNQEYKIAAGKGADDPKDGLNWEVGKGNFTVRLKNSDDRSSTEKVTVGMGEIWGVVIGPTGELLVLQLY